MATLREKMNIEMKIRGFSASTKTVYLRMVKELYEYYNKIPLAKLSSDQIKNYLVYLISDKKLSPKTCNLNVQALRFFYDVVLRKPISKYDLPRMREPKKLPDILSASEVEKIIKAAQGIKAKTVLIVAYGSGIRLSEVAHLRIQDIDSKRMVIVIQNGKCSKDRHVPLSPIMLDKLRNYWRQYRSKIKCYENWLFPGRNPRKPISIRMLSNYFQEARKKAGISKKVSFHSLRHAFATHALEFDNNLFNLRELLGHTKIQTTAVYLHMTEKKLGTLKSPIDALTL